MFPGLKKSIEGPCHVYLRPKYRVHLKRPLAFTTHYLKANWEPETKVAWWSSFGRSGIKMPPIVATNLPM
jgi:hypothetical protein